MLYGEDGKTAEAELDAVVRVNRGADQPPVMYIGSVKTYTDGEIVAPCPAPLLNADTAVSTGDVLFPFEGDSEATDLHKEILELEFRSQATDVPPSYLPFRGAELRGAFMVSVCSDR